MKVLRIQPKKYREVIEIDGSLESLQKEVAGPIQAVYPWDDPVALICNEEGYCLWYIRSTLGRLCRKS